MIRHQAPATCCPARGLGIREGKKAGQLEITSGIVRDSPKVVLSLGSCACHLRGVLCVRFVNGCVSYRKYCRWNGIRGWKRWSEACPSAIVRGKAPAWFSCRGKVIPFRQLGNENISGENNNQQFGHVLHGKRAQNVGNAKRKVKLTHYASFQQIQETSYVDDPWQCVTRRKYEIFLHVCNRSLANFYFMWQGNAIGNWHEWRVE